MMYDDVAEKLPEFTLILNHISSLEAPQSMSIGNAIDASCAICSTSEESESQVQFSPL